MATHVAFIIHITPSSLLNDPSYQSWSNQFNSKVKVKKLRKT